MNSQKEIRAQIREKYGFGDEPRVKHFTKKVERKLIDHPELGEIIELTYEGGHKLYMPNLDTYDLATGRVNEKMGKENE